MFGVRPVVVEASSGATLDGNGVEGVLCFGQPWPGIARSIWGDHDRYMATYLQPYPGKYFTGDGCRRDEDGYIWITGRVDDVLNVSGHRLGTAEIESALVGHPACVEAAVVGVPHDVKGQGIFAYVILKEGVAENAELLPSLKQAIRASISPSLPQSPTISHNLPQSPTISPSLTQAIRASIGGIASPDFIVCTPGLPKTRSGKIMRRVLRKIACREAQTPPPLDAADRRTHTHTRARTADLSAAPRRTNTISPYLPQSPTISAAPRRTNSATPRPSRTHPSSTSSSRRSTRCTAASESSSAPWRTAGGALSPGRCGSIERRPAVGGGPSPAREGARKAARRHACFWFCALGAVGRSSSRFGVGKIG